MKKTLQFTKKQLLFILCMLYLFNCLDLIFTYAYIKTGEFFETNPIMKHFVDNPYYCVLFKLCIPGLLLGCLCFCLDKLSLPRYRLYQTGLFTALIFYSLLIVLHLYYMLLYLFPALL